MHFILRRLWQWTKELPGRPGNRKMWIPKSVGDYFARMRGAQHYRGTIGPPPPVLIWSFFSGFTSFISIMVLGLITKYGAAIKDHHLPFAIAPAGASAVLIFAVPASPLAQPRNVVLGHMIAALIGTFMHALFLNVAESFRWMPGALSVGISIWLMGLTNCYHPPAGATAFIGGYSAPEIKIVGWWFPLYPVLPVSLIMVLVGIILNNFCRVYPIYWFTPVHLSKVHASAPALMSAPGSVIGTAQNRKPLETTHPNLETQAPQTSHGTSAQSSISSSLSSSSPSSSSLSRNVEDVVNDTAGNEAEAETSWMRLRIRELEKEIERLHAHHLQELTRLKTA
ncbi:hypothetical protein H4R20_005844 [Coemansia guatemalensis]|uniref:HPP transmembrane region domain-containing protein n=1 Tax=Coemansia guatemalensis TaxID=2761395 RepID=A0A9W8LRF7_9FUNG|nr:hypothetical protein H4R20_005844 [Coemansia guatemalensis]